MTRLGRGLGDILGEVDEAYEREITAKSSVDDIYDLDIENIVPNPHQPRKSFDEKALQELAESIKKHGLLQPVIVKKSDEGFLLLAGERRLRASKMAKRETIKAIITDTEFEKFRELALIENIQREELNPLEFAAAMESLLSEHNLTHEELSKRINKSRTQITNTLRLLQLDDYVKQKLLAGEISSGHARLLVGLDPKEQRIISDTIVGQKLSVRESEQLVKGHKNEKSGSKKTKPASANAFNLKGYKNRLKKHIPVDFKIKSDKLELKFKNEEEIETFLRYFKQL